MKSLKSFARLVKEKKTFYNKLNSPNIKKVCLIVFLFVFLKIFHFQFSIFTLFTVLITFVFLIKMSFDDSRTKLFCSTDLSSSIEETELIA